MKKLILLAFIFSFNSIYSQENIVSSGTNATSTSGTVNYSVGLINYKDASGTGGTSSPGVQNISEILNTLSIDAESLEQIKVFPNPTLDFIYVNFPNAESMKFRLVNILGKTLVQGTLNSQNDKIDVTKLRTASYFLILYKDNQKLKTFQIIKQ